jgi:hypothetical protein
MSQVQSRTIRFPEDVYTKGRQAAQRAGVSFNELVVASVAERLREEEDRALAAEFDLLGQSPEECDVEFMLPAIREVFLADDE